MKILLLLSALFVCLPAVITSQSMSHQQDNHDQVNQLHKFLFRPVKASLDDTLRYTYTYNNDVKILTSLSEKRSGSVWVNFERDTYTYDYPGNWLTFLHEIWSKFIIMPPQLMLSIY